MVTELLSTANWSITVPTASDLTGKTCHFIISSRENVEIARAATTGATGTITIGATGVSVSIPPHAHPLYTVPVAFVTAWGDLGYESGGQIVWVDRVDLRIFAGPDWN